MPTSRSQPTARQREYLSFIKAFTERWSVPPSFEEIGRHFLTTAPSVNNMIKTLEARGFLARVPGAARRLRVLVSDDDLREGPPPRRQRKGDVDTTVQVRTPSLVMERLLPALRDIAGEHLIRAVNAVVEALDVELQAAGASEDQRQARVRPSSRSPPSRRGSALRRGPADGCPGGGPRGNRRVAADGECRCLARRSEEFHREDRQLEQVLRHEDVEASLGAPCFVITRK
jgi:hypothetical protein